MPSADAVAIAPGPSRDRALVYGVLASLLRAPDEASLVLWKERIPAAREALERLAAPGSIARDLGALEAEAARTDVASLREIYDATFLPAGPQSCSPNEVSYTADTPQHALTRTFELADVAGFYRAFGLELVPGSERADHVAAELEFLHLLALKQGVAEAQGGAEEAVEVCRDASRSFLRDHVTRWLPRLAERLEACDAHPFYARAGRAGADFVAHDAASIGAA